MGRVPDDYEFKAGDVLVNRYRIDRPRGRGGMGEVYEATDLYLEKKVALKTIKPTDSSGLPRAWQAFEARFRLEAQIGVRLRDPRSFHDGRDRLVTILDCHLMPDGRPVALMDLFSGLTLANYLEKHGRVKFATACQIARDVCAGLSFAHDHDVIHRDIKPQNIMLEPGAQLRAYITDFGVGKLISPGGVMLTHEGGEPIGTPGWIPREQLLGLIPPSPATDMFAVGLLIFLMITGKGAFAHLGDDALRLILTNNPPKAPMFTDFIADYGEAEWALACHVARCLSHWPNERPDASTMAAVCARAERSARERDGGEALVEATIEDESRLITSMLVENQKEGASGTSSYGGDYLPSIIVAETAPAPVPGVAHTVPAAAPDLGLGSLPTEANPLQGPPAPLGTEDRVAMLAADRAREVKRSKVAVKPNLASAKTETDFVPPTASLPNPNQTPSPMSRTMDPATENSQDSLWQRSAWNDGAQGSAAPNVIPGLDPGSNTREERAAGARDGYPTGAAPPYVSAPRKRVLALAGLGSALGTVVLVSAAMLVYRYGMGGAAAPPPPAAAAAAELAPALPMPSPPPVAVPSPVSAAPEPPPSTPPAEPVASASARPPSRAVSAQPAKAPAPAAPRPAKKDRTRVHDVGSGL